MSARKTHPESLKMLWSLFRTLCAARKVPKHLQDATREELTAAALNGQFKSWSKLNTGDVSSIKAHLEAALAPDDLNKRIKADHPEDQERAALVHSIEIYLEARADRPHSVGIFFSTYVEAISAKIYGTKAWRELPVRDLANLRNIVKKNAHATNKPQLKNVPTNERAA